MLSQSLETIQNLQYIWDRSSIWRWKRYNDDEKVYEKVGEKVGEKGYDTVGDEKVDEWNVMWL